MKPRRIFWKIITALIIAAIVFYCGYRAYGHYFNRPATPPSVDSIPEIQTPDDSSSDATVPEPTSENINVISDKAEKPIPESGIIKVPFTSQAPFANWDATHEDACEEASLIMVWHHLQNNPISSKGSADKEILTLIDYESKNGYGPSITASDLAKIASDYYKLKGTVIKNATTDIIKKEIAKGNPVIVPAAGKILPNPNFRNGGPNYHMLVVTGYDSKQFITNDPGTRLGENFRYYFSDLTNAIHDWNPDNILWGEKNILVLTK